MDQKYRQQYESLSALMDNEADDLELRRLLKASEQDPELAQTWQRFHLAQALLHGPATAVSPELSQRIAAQIQQEANLSSSSSSNTSRLRQNLSKFAIAASVALVVIVTLQTTTTPDSLPGLAQQTQAPSLTADPVPAQLVAVESDPVELDADAQQRLREWIETMSFDEKEPVRTEHIQDSPLFRLVNTLELAPQ